MVSENKMLKAITRIHPHSWRFWTDWSLDQDRGRLFGILTDTHIPHMNAQYSVSELFLIDLFFFRIYLFMSLETKEFFSNESFDIHFKRYLLTMSFHITKHFKIPIQKPLLF